MGRRTMISGAVLALAVGAGIATASSIAAGRAAPRNQTPPAVHGNPAEGAVLTADQGVWKSGSTITYSYRWLRCLADGSSCVDIPKATDQIYTARSTDAAHSLRVLVTARNKDGAVSTVSGPTALVSPLTVQAPHNTVLPVIAGSTAPGRTLTATTGTWTGAMPIAFSYRWRRCDAGGGCRETPVRSQTYKLSSDDANHALRVLVSATNTAGTSASLSDPTSTIMRSSKPLNTSPPAISGTAQEGNTLTGTRGTWTNSPGGFGYRWLRCNKKGDNCSGIGGARGTSYTLTRSDAGHTIRFRVVATNDGGPATAFSAPTVVVTVAPRPAPSRPQTTSLPSISGTPRQGQTLRADRGVWTNNPTDYDYSWTRCNTAGALCNDISGADGTTYTVGSADVGHSLRFKVTGKNAGGSTTVFSPPTAVVGAAPAVKASPPAATSPVTISGTAQDGKTLTGHAGTWSNSPTDFDYSWRRCNTKGDDCDGIGGAHSTTYRLKAADVGTTIRLRVTAKNSGGSATAVSAPTALVRAAARPENSSPPSISGTLQEGKSLTGNRGNWTHSPTGFDYAWLRCDRNGGSCAAIGGARGTSYTLTSADVGSTVRFRVTASNSEGSATATSVPSAVVQKAAAPPQPPLPSGCPPRPRVTQVANIATISSPARLLVDALQSYPRVVTGESRVLAVRFHVTSSCGGPVQGALVYATATPFSQFSIPAEGTTGPDGWATLVFRRLRGFPVSGRQQLIAMFVRARKPGESVLGGISTRRLVSVPVRLG